MRLSSVEYLYSWISRNSHIWKKSSIFRHNAGQVLSLINHYLFQNPFFNENTLIWEASWYTDLLANSSWPVTMVSVRVPWWLFLFRVPWWLFSFSGFVVLRKSAHLLRCTDRWYTWRTVRYQISQSKPLHVCDNIYHHQVQEVQDLSLVLSSSLSAPATNTIILFCHNQKV